MYEEVFIRAVVDFLTEYYTVFLREWVDTGNVEPAALCICMERYGVASLHFLSPLLFRSLVDYVHSLFSLHTLKITDSSILPRVLVSYFLFFLLSSRRGQSSFIEYIEFLLKRQVRSINQCFKSNLRAGREIGGIV